MVGENKLAFAKTSTKDIYFVFSFTDGLYYWKYNEEDIINDLVKIREGGRGDRGSNEYKSYAFIQNKLLEKV
jgi:hypothetical protein